MPQKGWWKYSVLSMAQIFMAFFALCTLYFHQPFWGMMNEANQIFNPTSDGYICWSLFKYALSMLWMIPTSFFAGMTLPLITLILTRAFKSEAPIGKVYGWNTPEVISDGSNFTKMAGIIMTHTMI